MLSYHVMGKMNNRLVSPVRMGQAFINNSHCRYNGGFPIEETGPARVVLVLTGAIRFK